MVVLKQRQYFELACSHCSFENLIEGPDWQLHCSNCHRAGAAGDCAVVSVQTEIVEEADTGTVVLEGNVTLTSGHVYEIAETPLRCPKCGALGVEVAADNVGACFACYSAITMEDCVLDCRDTEQVVVMIPITQRIERPVAVPVPG